MSNNNTVNLGSEMAKMGWTDLPTEIRHMILLEVLKNTLPNLQGLEIEKAWDKCYSTDLPAHRGDPPVKHCLDKSKWPPSLRRLLSSLVLVSPGFNLDLQHPIERIGFRSPRRGHRLRREARRSN